MSGARPPAAGKPSAPLVSDLFERPDLSNAGTREAFETLCKGVIKSAPAVKYTGQIRHIAFVTWGLRLGGAERVACLLAELLQGAGFKVTFFNDEPRTLADYPHTAERVVLSQEPAKRWKQVQTSCRSLGVDLCLFTDHSMPQMLYDLLALKLAGCRVIPWEHSVFFYPLYEGEPSLIFWRDQAYRFADAIACLSDTHADFWRAAGLRRAVGLPNPLTFEPGLGRRSTGQEKNIIFMGRLCELKGAETALRVLAALRRTVPEARLVFLGRFASTSHELEYRALARELKIEEHVSFEGHVADVSAHLARAAAHIMPSQCEGSPMVLMEAKAHGVPSVLFEMKYLDFVSEEHGCLMVGKNDQEGMAAALARLLQDSEYWRMMSDRAYESLALIDNREVLKKWLELFEDLEKGRPVGGEEGRVYANDPTWLLETAMREMTCAMREVFRARPSRYLAGYLSVIQRLVDICLPVGSRRRRYAKFLAKCAWKILKNIKNTSCRLRFGRPLSRGRQQVV